jgi:hypothetical protein
LRRREEKGPIEDPETPTSAGAGFAGEGVAGVGGELE